MGIIKHGRNTELKVISFEAVDSGSDEIPFVPATDLVPSPKRLSDSEASAIGLALYLMTPDENLSETPWALSARDSGLRR